MADAPRTHVNFPEDSIEAPFDSLHALPTSRVRGLVELTPKCSDEILRKLTLAAYEASRQGTVVLALNGVSPALVDRYLDASVQASGWGEGDLLYLPIEAIDEELLSCASGADFVIVQSSALSAALFSRGIGYMSPPRGVRYLHSLSAPKRRMPVTEAALAI